MGLKKLEHLDIICKLVCKIALLKKCMNEFTKTIGYWKYAPCGFLCKNTVKLNSIIKINSPKSNTLLTQVYTLSYNE